MQLSQLFWKLPSGPQHFLDVLVPGWRGAQSKSGFRFSSAPGMGARGGSQDPGYLRGTLTGRAGPEWAVDSGFAPRQLPLTDPCSKGSTGHTLPAARCQRGHAQFFPFVGAAQSGCACVRAQDCVPAASQAGALAPCPIPEHSAHLCGRSPVLISPVPAQGERKGDCPGFETLPGICTPHCRLPSNVHRCSTHVVTPAARNPSSRFSRACLLCMRVASENHQAPPPRAASSAVPPSALRHCPLSMAWMRSAERQPRVRTEAGQGRASWGLRAGSCGRFRLMVTRSWEQSSGVVSLGRVTGTPAATGKGGRRGWTGRRLTISEGQRFPDALDGG